MYLVLLVSAALAMLIIIQRISLSNIHISAIEDQVPCLNESLDRILIYILSDTVLQIKFRNDLDNINGNLCLRLDIIKRVRLGNEKFHNGSVEPVRV